MAIDWTEWDDDYEPPPPWWKRSDGWLWVAVGAVASVFVGKMVLDASGGDISEDMPPAMAATPAADSSEPSMIDEAELAADATATAPSVPGHDSGLPTTKPDETVLASGLATALDEESSTAGKKKAAGRQWVQHEVIPGERVADIAARYQVAQSAILRWNKLDKKRPKLRVGQNLKVWAKRVPPPRERMSYTVERGDSWIGIARKFGVERRDLRRWNYKAPKNLHPGNELRLWVDVVTPAASPKTPQAASANALPMVKIKSGATSVGTPNRGKIANAIQLPANDALYRVSNPDHAWGTTNTFQLLQLSVASFRTRSQYKGDVIVGAVSRRGGGRFRPHRSHQSGRDVDVWLPARGGKKSTKRPERASDVDWDAAWALISAFIDTGQVEYVFLNYARQRQLYDAARRAGVPKNKRDAWIEYPDRSSRGKALIRHAEGHKAHFHVRLRCAKHEVRCND